MAELPVAMSLGSHPKADGTDRGLESHPKSIFDHQYCLMVVIY